jgi:hypothetical protein
MSTTTKHLLSTVRVGEIPPEESPRRWLIEHLWSASSVGVIGGQPKLGKSWLGLDMAVSVATGTPCLDTFPVQEPGPVLVYLAEDALPILRERIACLVNHRRLELLRVNLHVITEPTLRLDRAGDRMRLMATAMHLRPRLVLLDPLVRLHAANENDATEIAQLLSYFRDLQRRLDTSVTLVHHSRKHSSGGSNGGQNLRGSSDIWAFGDSFLYLRRIKDRILLSMEHRAAAAPDPVFLRLVTTDDAAIHFEVTATVHSEKERRDRELREAVLTALAEAPVLTRGRLREILGVKNERLGRILNDLTTEGLVERTAQGWRAAGHDAPLEIVPRSPAEGWEEGNGSIRSPTS